MSRPARILIPPGIGDAYWCLCKLESLIDRYQLGVPDVWTWETTKETYIRGKPRATQFCQRFPFINYRGGDMITLDKPGVAIDTFLSAYSTPMRPENPRMLWLHRRKLGFDFVVHCNGILEAGHSLDDAVEGIGDFETNWYPPYRTDPNCLQRQREYQNRYGRYIATMFSGATPWDEYYFPRKAVSLRHMRQRLDRLRQQAGADRVVLFGARWDRKLGKSLLSDDSTGWLVDICGQTTYDELVSLFLGSVGVFGGHCGATMEAVRLKVPTGMVFTKKFDRWPPNFIRNHVPPDSYNNWYFPRYVEELYDDYMSKLGEVFRGS